MEDIVNKSKTIANYLGWKYVPFSKDNDRRPGWYKPSTGILKGSVSFSDGEYWKHVCRKHNQLRFYNSFDFLVPAIESLEAEDLSNHILYFEYIEFVRDNFICEVQLLAWPAPLKVIGIGEGKGIIKDTFEAIVEAIEFINNLKNNKNENG